MWRHHEKSRRLIHGRKCKPHSSAFHYYVINIWNPIYFARRLLLEEEKKTIRKEKILLFISRCLTNDWRWLTMKDGRRTQSHYIIFFPPSIWKHFLGSYHNRNFIVARAINLSIFPLPFFSLTIMPTLSYYYQQRRGVFTGSKTSLKILYENLSLPSCNKATNLRTFFLSINVMLFNHFNAHLLWFAFFCFSSYIFFWTITHLLSESLHNFSFFADYAANFL